MYYIQFSDHFNKIIKINNYIMLCYTIHLTNYQLIHYLKLIIVHPINTVLIVDLTFKFFSRMNNSCTPPCQNSTPYDQCTLNGTYRISATGWNFLIKIEIYLN